MGIAFELDDDTAHELAVDHLLETLGLTVAPEVTWDTEHHLQGHFDYEGHHMVLIAPRRSNRAPLVLSDGDWDVLRRPRCRSHMPAPA